MAIHPSLAAWDEPLGASETVPKRNRVREDGRSASGEGPAPAGSTLATEPDRELSQRGTDEPCGAARPDAVRASAYAIARPCGATVQ